MRSPVSSSVQMAPLSPGLKPVRTPGFVKMTLICQRFVVRFSNFDPSNQVHNYSVFAFISVLLIFCISHSFIKSGPNDRNISTQHISILLSKTCCTRSMTLLQYVAASWLMLTSPIRTCRNMSQQSECCIMLR